MPGINNSPFWPLQLRCCRSEQSWKWAAAVSDPFESMLSLEVDSWLTLTRIKSDSLYFITGYCHNAAVMQWTEQNSSTGLANNHLACGAMSLNGNKSCTNSGKSLRMDLFFFGLSASSDHAVLLLFMLSTCSNKCTTGNCISILVVKFKFQIHIGSFSLELEASCFTLQPCNAYVQLYILFHR